MAYFTNFADLKSFKSKQFRNPNFQTEKKRKRKFKKIEKGHGQANQPRPESRPSPASRSRPKGYVRRHRGKLIGGAYLSSLLQSPAQAWDLRRCRIKPMPPKP
jgi:hypothetical protein